MSGLELTGQLETDIAPLPSLNRPVGVNDVGQLSLSLGRSVGVKGRGRAHQQKRFSAQRVLSTDKMGGFLHMFLVERTTA